MARINARKFKQAFVCLFFLLFFIRDAIILQENYEKLSRKMWRTRKIFTSQKERMQIFTGGDKVQHSRAILEY